MRAVGVESDPLDNKPARNTRWLLGGIVLLAISIRAWGIDFGLPYLYHPDEPVPVGIAQTMFKTGDLNPHFFHWPSMIFYLNAAAYIPYYFAGKLMGVFSSPSDILGPIWLVMGVGLSPMPTTWLLGRCLTAAFGSASVILVADERGKQPLYHTGYVCHFFHTVVVPGCCASIPARCALALRLGRRWHRFGSIVQV
jgi:hypothetical protein